jgi:hypothetical protein
MKAVLVILLVCVAGTYAESGPFNGLLENLSATLQETINSLLQNILSLLPTKPRLSFQTLLTSLNLQQAVNDFIVKIKETLVGLVAQVLSGSPKSMVHLKMETEERLFQQLGDLVTQLGSLTGTLISSLPNLGNILGKRDALSDLLNNVQSQIQTAVDGLKPQISNIINSILGQLLGGKRNSILDFILNAFNLGGVWDTISALGGSVVAQFTGIASQLLFAGQTVWNNAQPIFNQLVADLTNHAGDAVTIVAQAIASLNQVIGGAGKRDLAKASILDFILNAFNLGGVWDTISALGGSVVAQFTAIASQLLFAGQTVWNNAQPIFNQLVADLTNHAGDAVTIVAQAIASLNQVIGGAGKRAIAQKDLLSTIVTSLGLDSVWSTITALGSSVYLQFVQIGTQLLFAGSQIWAQVTPVLNQLKDDLINHTGDAVTIVAQSIASLNQILGSGKRELIQKDLLSTIVSSLGLDSVWSTITALGSSVYLQFVQIGTQLLFAGSQIWAQVTPVLNQLKDDLINHTGDAVSIVAQSIASLNQILGSSGKRDLLSTIVSSLGLDAVWSTIQGLGSSVYLQFVQIGTQLLFAGSQIWAQVTPILNQLKDDLLNHTGDAVTIVAQSIASLNQILG